MVAFTPLCPFRPPSVNCEGKIVKISWIYFNNVIDHKVNLNLNFRTPGKMRIFEKIKKKQFLAKIMAFSALK